MSDETTALSLSRMAEAEDSAMKILRANMLEDLQITEASNTQSDLIERAAWITIEIKRIELRLRSTTVFEEYSTLHKLLNMLRRELRTYQKLLGLLNFKQRNDSEDLDDILAGNDQVIPFDKQSAVSKVPVSINVESLPAIPKLKKKEHTASKSNIKARRAAMMERLGGKCVDCGETDITKLEPDHKDGRTWRAEDLTPSKRWDMYEADERAGKIQEIGRAHV